MAIAAAQNVIQQGEIHGSLGVGVKFSFYERNKKNNNKTSGTDTSPVRLCLFTLTTSNSLETRSTNVYTVAMQYSNFFFRNFLNFIFRFHTFRKLCS